MLIYEKGILQPRGWVVISRGGDISQANCKENGKWWADMFPGSTEPELEAGFIRSGRRFRPGKRIKTLWGRWRTILFEESKYEFESPLDEGSSKEEEYYNPISKGEKESEESMETPKSKCHYTTPGTSWEVSFITSSPERNFNTNSTSAATSVQGSTPSPNCSLNTPNANSMIGEDIRLPTFNGNGGEDPEQYWFLYEAV